MYIVKMTQKGKKPEYKYYTQAEGLAEQPQKVEISQTKLKKIFDSMPKDERFERTTGGGLLLEYTQDF